MLWITWLACSPVGPAQPDVEVAPDPIVPVDPGEAMVAFQVSFDEAQAHRVGVEGTARCPETGVLEWWMPVWTPGSYLVREYARHVEQIEGIAGPLTKVSKNRWRQACTAGEPAGIRYTLYARTLSVRDAFVDRELGVLNGAAVFVLPDLEGGVVDLQVRRPEGWAAVHTALPPHPAGEPDRFLAPTVDTLIDSPLVLGNPDVRSFEIEGVPHWVVTVGEPGPFDLPGVAAEVERIAREAVRFWGTIPYREYRFLTVLSGRRGGLEHLDSTLMTTSRWSTVKRADRLRYLGLVSHEFFHTWNVKRLRPRGLGPFDYESEVYTSSLWIAEGLTSYYDDVLLVRAGLLTEDEYLERMAKNVERLQTRPGRLLQPLGEASFDAWIKHYRGDENTTNHTVSYYTKGAVVGWLLDARIRRATRGRASLDDVMRLVWERHRVDGYTPEAFRAVASEVAGTDLAPFFEGAVDRAEELDFGGALQWWGLQWAPVTPPTGDDPDPGWLGATTRSDKGRLVVSQVQRGGPAFGAGLNVGDEILAIGDERVTLDTFDERLTQLGAGASDTWLIARREHLRRVDVTLGAVPEKRWVLQRDPGASPIAARRRAAWLGTGGT